MLPVVRVTASDGKNVAAIDPEFFYGITCKKLYRRLRAAKIICEPLSRRLLRKDFLSTNLKKKVNNLLCIRANSIVLQKLMIMHQK
jgi:hypothetical protein